MGVKAVRIIRHRGSMFAVLQGGSLTFPSLASLAAFSRRQHKVYAYSTEEGRQGVMRSGRLMRFVDLNVRNTPPSFDRMILNYLDDEETGKPLVVNIPKASF